MTDSTTRPRIAFFASNDVFEDFYPHYGIDQRAFAKSWENSGNHARLALIQREIGDVIWYEFSLKPEYDHAQHATMDFQIRMLRSGWLHRWLWKAFYLPRCAWRWRKYYRVFGTVASYVALISRPFWKAIRADRPDCILVQDYVSGRFDVLFWLARRLRVPLVAVHTGGVPENYLGRRIRKWTLPHVGHVIASSQREMDMLQERFQVPRERMNVVLTPMDTNQYRPRDRLGACNDLGLDPNRRYLLFVGRLSDREKRISSIIRSFARVADAHPTFDLLIVGEGRDRDELVEQANELCPSRVCFVGWVADADSRANYYNSADCLLLASPREGFPAVVGEAMCCGTPVLSTDVGALRELVTPHETGWLVPAGDEEEFAATLSEILKRPETLAAMRPSVRQRALGRVAPDVVAAQLGKCFELVRRSGRPGTNAPTEANQRDSLAEVTGTRR